MDGSQSKERALIQDDAQRAMLRAAAVRRLATLRERDELTNAQIAMVAALFEVHPRTINRWIGSADGEGWPTRRARFEITDALLVDLAYHRGNAASVHRELVKRAAAGGPPAPSLATVERAIRRDLTPGQRDGLRKGERARRSHDVYLRRPQVPRNAVWEGDHVEASNWVDVDGTLVKPWVTWFVDCGTCALPGAVITPCYPSRESVLVALRVCISRSGRFGQIGALPEHIRIDQGKDFLSRAVQSSMAVFAVQVDDLPGYSPYLKGRIEAVNRAVKKTLFSTLPRYTGAQTGVNNKPSDPNAPPLTFAAFVAEVFNWITDWNTVHPKASLGGRTPLEAWNADPTPLTHVPDQDLALFTLEEEGKAHPITTNGVAFQSRFYVGDWMVGQADGDQMVRVRWLPNHPEVIEVFCADTGEHLGAAYPSDEATPEQIKELVKARKHEAKQLRSVLKSADRNRRVRYAAATEPAPPRALGAVSALQAEVEIAEKGRARAAAHARPDLFPPRPGAASWVAPRPPRQVDEPEGARDEPKH